MEEVPRWRIAVGVTLYLTLLAALLLAIGEIFLHTHKLLIPAGCMLGIFIGWCFL